MKTTQHHETCNTKHIVAVFVIGVVCANDDSGGIHAAVFELWYLFQRVTVLEWFQVTAWIRGLEGGTRPSLRHADWCRYSVSLTSTEEVTPLVSSMAVIEIQQGDVVQLQVKHCWGAICGASSALGGCLILGPPILPPNFGRCHCCFIAFSHLFFYVSTESSWFQSCFVVFVACWFVWSSCWSRLVCWIYSTWSCGLGFASLLSDFVSVSLDQFRDV